ncbi:GNAT family N-acetyltransferase [uncultured Agrococcus sp.]|uniref:GNAT family N-acetyltransferase n=1 Tax=uncultured Agrococcus sp. TaxID=382258 RepID=UPI0025FBCBBF|nr:GNAT family N-acetyltransferase [uncultured Agrococcus sp.]
MFVLDEAGRGKLDTIIRPIEASEVDRLADFLYLAVHQPDPDNPIPRSILAVPEVAAYIQEWGKPDDACLVAVKDQRLVGAVWTRIIAGEVRGYGNIDAHTPEFSVSVLPVCRGRGIGALLMRQMLELLRERGYSRASLSVQKSNPALRLYERLGFKAVADHDDEIVMVYDFSANELQ